MATELDALLEAVRQFARDRDWEQFHSPKNLACALSVEAAELLEHFQWLTDEQSRALTEAKRDRVEQEIADVFLYLLQIADKLNNDLLPAAQRKLIANAAKYPPDQSRGTSKKYTEL